MMLNPPPSQAKLVDEPQSDRIWKSWFSLLYDTLKKLSFATKTAAYTAGREKVILVNTSGGSLTVTLPPASDNEGNFFYIKDIDSGVNTVTIDGNGAETIDGAATLVLAAARGTALIFCDGSQWHRLGN